MLFRSLHKAILQDESTNIAVEHVFAYVLWKKVHPFCDFLEFQAVSSDLFETSSVRNCLPAQRIDIALQLMTLSQLILGV